MFFLWIGQYKFVHFGTFWIIFEVKGRFSETFESVQIRRFFGIGAAYCPFHSTLLCVFSFPIAKFWIFPNLSSVLAISRIYGQWEKNNDLCTIFIIIELFCEHCFIAEYLAKLLM